MPGETGGYAVELPYPEVVSGPDNRRTVLMLMEDYAGLISETTATMQYVYGHIVLNRKEKEISDALHRIALAEMRHLDLIGEAIHTLGGDPYYASRGRFWNARYVNYANRPKEVLTENIKGEQEAIRQYRRHAEMTGNGSVSNLIERIILDEELHIRLLNSLLAKT